tara:strand:+ start:1687 stop:1908 length:222 start_codon:yes stop_codon:yes gene_type:complete
MIYRHQPAGANVNVLSVRSTHPTTEDISTDPGFTPEGTLQALAACGKHYGFFDKAAIWVGDLPCPNGCATPAW